MHITLKFYSLTCVGITACSYGDFTTQSGTAEGLWFENGTAQMEKVKMLSRTYAQVYMYVLIIIVF